MLMIQSSFKTDLESNRTIFVLYMRKDDGEIYNCSIDYDLIKNNPTPQQVVNNIMPMINSLCAKVYENLIDLPDSITMDNVVVAISSPEEEPLPPAPIAA